MIKTPSSDLNISSGSGSALQIDEEISAKKSPNENPEIIDASQKQQIIQKQKNFEENQSDLEQEKNIESSKISDVSEYVKKQNEVKKSSDSHKTTLPGSSQISSEDRVTKIEKKLATSISSISSQLEEKKLLNEPDSLEDGEIVSRDGHENTAEILPITAEKSEKNENVPEIVHNRGSAKRKSA